MPASAMDSGQYSNSPLKYWFDGLKNARGDICCALADGISDVIWESSNGHYRVLLDGDWIDVPDDVVLKIPNLFGRTMVWPSKGKPTFIRCFLPGTMG